MQFSNNEWKCQSQISFLLDFRIVRYGILSNVLQMSTLQRKFLSCFLELFQLLFWLLRFLWSNTCKYGRILTTLGQISGKISHKLEQTKQNKKIASNLLSNQFAFFFPNNYWWSLKPHKSHLLLWLLNISICSTEPNSIQLSVQSYFGMIIIT